MSELVLFKLARELSNRARKEQDLAEAIDAFFNPNALELSTRDRHIARAGAFLEASKLIVDAGK